MIGPILNVAARAFRESCQSTENGMHVLLCSRGAMLDIKDYFGKPRIRMSKAISLCGTLVRQVPWLKDGEFLVVKTCLREDNEKPRKVEKK